MSSGISLIPVHQGHNPVPKVNNTEAKREKTGGMFASFMIH